MYHYSTYKPQEKPCLTARTFFYSLVAVPVLWALISAFILIFEK